MIRRGMDSALNPTSPRAQVLRFIAAGIGNTLISLGFYQAALFMVGYWVAYVSAYVVGVALAYYLYARHVFMAQTSGRGFAAFVLFYAAAGLLGGTINAALIDGLGWPARWAIFVTVSLMLPVNYVGSRWCLLGKERG